MARTVSIDEFSIEPAVEWINATCSSNFSLIVRNGIGLEPVTGDRINCAFYDIFISNDIEALMFQLKWGCSTEIKVDTIE